MYLFYLSSLLTCYYSRLYCSVHICNFPLPFSYSKCFLSFLFHLVSHLFSFSYVGFICFLLYFPFLFSSFLFFLLYFKLFSSPYSPNPVFLFYFSSAPTYSFFSPPPFFVGFVFSYLFFFSFLLSFLLCFFFPNSLFSGGCFRWCCRDLVHIFVLCFAIVFCSV
uniref:Uncharacterized protein n=1 Tax=Myotis myotis TaxID=51298 RepID=A0A7J8AM90_MYOMY|nr:hypothetical protein mMyoMyo1_007984 [Myotis myotis]